MELLHNISKQLPPTYAAKFWRSLIEFEQIQAKDRIIVGFSGGKDSIFLLFLFALLKNNFPFPLCVEALHIDNNFSDEKEQFIIHNELTRYCQELSIPLHFHHLPMTDIWNEKKNKSPCFICAKYRRGALANWAKEHNFNKIALAHHQDDAVETLLLNLFQSGQHKTFHPTSFMSRMEITVIRPLSFFREQEIIDAMPKIPWKPIKNPCPHSTNTKRSEIREWLKIQEAHFPELFEKLSRSLRQDQIKELWPPLPGRQELRQKLEQFWKK